MLILNLQKMSTEDGPGIRTTVFAKGCPLSCSWCHNPESISRNIQLEWIASRCIDCAICIDLCRDKALGRQNEELIIDRGKCSLCLKCVEECPTLALESKGEEIAVNNLYEELVKDRAYYGKEGGVTLSGGEIMIQADEAMQLLKMLREDGIHTAVDTSGYCSRSDLEKVIPYTDLFLYDIKHIEDSEHKKLTGQGNKIILENLKHLLAKLKGTTKKIWIRTPIIPGATDSDHNISLTAEMLKPMKIDKWELCAFNNLGRDKYARLSLDLKYGDCKLMTAKRMQELKTIAEKKGIKNVVWTGQTRLQ